VTRQPNLFILGAPKCGTTSLATWLGQHPEVFVPRVKEPHHYNRDEKQVYYPDRNDYLNLFVGGEPARYRLDASVWYLHSAVAVSEILKDCPDARFLVCLRNPVDMAFSLHSQYLNKSGRENIRSFEQAWSLSDERLRGLCTSSLALEPAYLAYKYSCRIGSQSERLLRQVDRDRVHFVVLDDLIHSQEESLSAVLSVLGLSPDLPLGIPHENAAISRRSPLLHRVFMRLAKAKHELGLGTFPKSVKALVKHLHDINAGTRKPTLRPETRRMVTDYFLGEIHAVWRTTGRQYQPWVSCLDTDVEAPACKSATPTR
jgi:hypothetical protein